MSNSLTIVILTYNSAAIISSCLSRINISKYQVALVDNNSSDETVEIVKKNFPSVEVIKLDKNVGYGCGNNAALKKVKTKYALVLNPDAFIEEQDIDKIIEEMEKDEEIALAGPVLLKKYPIDPSELESAKNFIENDLNSLRDMYNAKFGNKIVVRIVIGACVFFRISVFQKIGFFDERFFMYYEDDEICRRVRNSGYKNVVFDDIYAFHIGGGSTKKTYKDIFKRSWHLYGWSKFLWRELRKGKFIAKKTASRVIFKYLFCAIYNMIFFNKEKIIVNLGAFCGTLYYLVGLSAFDSKGEGRG